MPKYERIFKAEISNGEFTIFHTYDKNISNAEIHVKAEEEARLIYGDIDEDGYNIIIFEVEEIDENYNFIQNIF